MKRKLIVSIISEQTFPNVQFIKEMKHRYGDEFDYVFITTETMKERGYLPWIEKASEIVGSKEILIERANENAIHGIVQKLTDYDFSPYNSILVNITGGTKLLILAVNQFFSTSLHADFFYVEKNNQYFKLGEKEETLRFTFAEKLEDYLFAYGFEYKKSKASGVEKDTRAKLYKQYLSGIFDDNVEAFKELWTLRNKSKAAMSDCLQKFVQDIEFKTHSPKEISKEQVKYLTGEWFEEWLGYKIKEELSLNDDQLFIGVTLNKEFNKTKREENLIKELLGDAAKENIPKNEFDVLFIYKGSLYVIECKTSIIDGEGKLILGDTIYKSDSLRTKLGLYAKSYIFTLTDLKKYIGSENNRATNLSQLVQRANLSNIKIIDKNLIEGKSILELLEITI